MIKETYCSFKVSKLLKEKGFDAPTIDYYDNTGKTIYGTLAINRNFLKGQISKPTHQLAMAWLREKKIFIYIRPLENGNCFSSHILYNEIDKLVEGWSFGTYEEAVEAALKFCLTELM